jgi:phenylalanyl-tRNA synthetase beta chain
MKFTLSWLRRHLDTDADLDTITDRLTMLGLELVAVIDRAKDLAPFIVGYVEEAAQHPNADRLKVCKVNTGTEILEVVCGAPNARAGMKGVFAPIGSYIPGTGITLETRAIRGVTGHGMLCSEKEMGLSEDHEGIIELPDDAPVGMPFAAFAGLDDPVIDLAITPDRGDCFGVLGIARDLAAAGLGTLVTPEIETVPGGFDSPIAVRLAFDADTANACPYFVGRYFRGIKNGPSPEWLRRQLSAVGLRPISALVDITNYVTLDRARPLHVFDADALAGGIHVRLSRGETLAALDDKTYTLDDAMTVVADDDGPVGLGGVIGGESTACTADTVNVFLESALFDPVRTATTGRKLNIDSDARHRFERGVDPAGAEPGMEIASRMILDLCGGEASAPVFAGAEPDWRRAVPFRPTRVHALGGLDVVKDECRAILGALGFDSAGDGETLDVSVPPWRADIDGEADLVEEVLRVKGYAAIPPVSMPREGALPQPAVTPGQRRVRLARRVLAARGLDECVTWSFLGAAEAKTFGGGAPELKLDNPISSELTDMRPSLLPNLIAAIGRNVARGFDDLAFFEVGPIYADDTPEGQATVAGGARRGHTGPRHWLEAPRAVDAFDAKGDAFAVLAALGAPVDRLTVTRDAPGWYHPGRSGVIRLGPKNALAQFGELHPGILAALDVAGPLVGFEVVLDNIPARKAKATAARPVPKMSDYPAVERDFAFVVDNDVSAEKLLGAVRALSGKGPHKVDFTGLGLFDVYTGEGVPEGRKSMALSVTLRPFKRTLTDADIQAICDAIVAQVAKVTGGELRG